MGQVVASSGMPSSPHDTFSLELTHIELPGSQLPQ